MNYRRICILVIVFCISNLAQTVEDEDDFDGVTVEEEVVEDKNINDIPYESPVPSDRKSVYLAEHFDDINKVEKKWVRSQAKKDGIAEEISKYDGIWKVEASQKDNLIGDLGLVLKSKAKHAAISSKLEKPFVFANKPLIVQYEVILQEGQECGGAYLKLLSDGPETKDLKQFQDKTPYTIMFGPDKCGNDHKLHFIFRHKNPLNGTLEEKHCRKPKDRLEDTFKDKLPHLYTLIIRPDNTFEIWIDRKVINSGSLLEDFAPPVNPPAEIDDPEDRKPEDWDEREKIADPDATKPEDWDEDAPATITDPDAIKPDGWLDDESPMIPDPEAKQPDDWDAEMDGEWEAPLIDNPNCATSVGCGKWEQPMISNPAYKGKWRAPLINNPNYKGKWKPRRIPNPDFYEDKHPFKMNTISAVGFELWSMSQDILFDNIIITDELSVANQWADDTFELKRKKIAKDSESVIQRMLVYTEEYPWLWAVYVIVIGFPIVLILYCCCKTGEKDKEEEKEEYDAATAATAKKTDELTKDDEPKEKEEKEVSDSEKKDEKEEKEEEGSEGEHEEEETVPEPSPSGDAPRKRKVRKE